MTNRTIILEAIRTERHRQLDKWGDQRHLAGSWLAILLEEIGEVCKASLENRREDVHRELIQAGAVIVAWLEHLAEEPGSSLNRLTFDPACVYPPEVLIDRLTGIDLAHYEDQAEKRKDEDPVAGMLTDIDRIIDQVRRQREDEDQDPYEEEIDHD